MTNNLVKMGRYIFKRNNNNKQLETIIPEEYENVVLKHVICNITATSINNRQYPLLLGIQGPYGFGKTYMVREICKKYKIILIALSSSELSGAMEGDSKKNLQSKYENICIDVSKKRRCAVLLIDDFHLTIATEDAIGKTINTNLLASYLMNLCDEPDIANVRVPIILTGNNYKRVYPAIVRDGRMDIYTWNPTIKDITPIVRHIFNSKFLGIEDRTISSILQQYSEMSIAFFEQVSQDLMNSNIVNTIDAFKKNKGDMSIAQLSDSVKESLSSLDVTEDNLMDICRKRKEAFLINFEKIQKKQK